MCDCFILSNQTTQEIRSTNCENKKFEIIMSCNCWKLKLLPPKAWQRYVFGGVLVWLTAVSVHHPQSAAAAASYSSSFGSTQAKKSKVSAWSSWQNAAECKLALQASISPSTGLEATSLDTESIFICRRYCRASRRDPWLQFDTEGMIMFTGMLFIRRRCLTVLQLSINHFVVRNHL